MTDALIHLRVPAATKAVWVRQSRAAGMRLTDWIVRNVESAMAQHPTAARIPADLPFSALRLQRDPDGNVSFDWAPIQRICDASGIDISILRDSAEDNVAGLIIGWYQQHVAHGGEPDATAEDLIAETRAEDERGSSISHQPGRA